MQVIQRAAGAAMAAVVAWASPVAQGQVSASGPYLAMPSWDQTLPAASRFVILTNFNSRAVLDRETGLVWERTPATTVFVSFAGASALCIDFNTTGNRKGWRLPTVQELLSLVDPSAFNPALPAGHPFLGIEGSYWSATVSDSDSASAWNVGFTGGLALRFSKDSTGVRVWCVRGGSNSAPQ